jgi:hypothetical protein
MTLKELRQSLERKIKMIVGSLQVNFYETMTGITLTKKYNNSVVKYLDLNEDEIYQLEFIIKETKRRFNLK